MIKFRFCRPIRWAAATGLFLGVFGLVRAAAPEVFLPSVASIVAGQPFEFSVTVYSGGPITRYEWFKNGVAIDGQTTSLLRLGAATPAMAGAYKVRVSNAESSTTTGECVVTVAPATPPSLGQSPPSLTVFLSDPARFSIDASGSPPLTYEWRRDGVLVYTNTVDNTFEILSTRPNDAGTYTVTVRNVAGAVTSTKFTLKLTPVTAPIITRHPISQTVPFDTTVLLDATVSGIGPWVSTWRKDGAVVAVSQSGPPRLVLTDVAATREKQAGTYTVTVANRFGSAVSEPAVVAFEAPGAPVFRLQPLSQTFSTGSFEYLYFIAAGTEPFTYQWRKDGVAIAGATASQYSRSSWTPAEAGRYTVVVTNAYGSAESQPAIIRIRAPAADATPIVTRHPSTVTAVAGTDAAFVVVAQSRVGASLAYQWQREGQPIAGATTDVLTLAKVSASDAADYRCVITDKGGSVTSHAGRLSVVAAAVNGFARFTGDLSVAVGQTSELEATPMFASADGFYRLSLWRTAPERQVSIPGFSSFTIYGAKPSDAGDYFGQLEVFDRQNNLLGTYRSPTIHFEVRENLPEFSRHPESWSASQGGSAVLQCFLFEPAGVAYQWYRNGALLPGATNSSLGINPVDASTIGDYTVVATNSRGSVTSEPGHLTMLSASDVTLTYHPASVAVPFSGQVLFTVGTTAQREYRSYPATWYHSGQAIAGETSQNLSLYSIRPDAEGTYYAVVHAPGGDLTSRTATLTVIDRPSSPAIVAAPIDIQARPGQLASLAVAASGSEPLHYTWFKGNVAVPDSDRPVLTMNPVSTTDAADYHVVVTNPLGTATSASATLRVSRAARIANLSARVQIGTGEAVAITGFVVRGAGEKRLLLRGIGPALLDAGVTHAIGSTEIRLHNSAGNMIGTNPVWYTLSYPAPLGRAEMVVTGAEVGAFPINGYSGDAAMVTRLEAGAYSVHAAGLNDASGIGLVEVYDADREGSSVRLVNLSCRASVGTGERVAITGLVIDGEGSQRVLLRVAGPALLGQGVVNALKRPRLELFDVRGTSMAANEQWETGNDRATIATVAVQVGAFSFTPGSNDAALLVTLPPGVYSAIASGVGATEGIALIEVYEVP